MPGFDGTGPMGAGPMTGGGRGYCNPSGMVYGRPGFGFGGGRGFRRGFGLLRGGAYPIRGWYGASYYPYYGSPYTTNPRDEVDMLRDEANAIKGQLDAINRRIQELESGSQKI